METDEPALKRTFMQRLRELVEREKRSFEASTLEQMAADCEVMAACLRRDRTYRHG